MVKHERGASNIAQEHNGSEGAEDVLRGAAEAGANLTCTIAGALLLGDGQWLASGPFDGGLDQIFLLLGVDDAVPCGTGYKGSEQDESVEELRFAQDVIRER
jgi:hypothetical protein